MERPPFESKAMALGILREQVTTLFTDADPPETL
jgi:hypothetical protein